jgi:hypothetical protein
MICTNCLNEGDDVIVVLTEKKYYACPNCIVTYAKDRTGEAFLLEEEVYLRPLYAKTEGRRFVIKGIYIMEECESGRMIHVHDKETGRPFKSVLDTNWLIKIKN